MTEIILPESDRLVDLCFIFCYLFIPLHRVL